MLIEMIWCDVAAWLSGNALRLDQQSYSTSGPVSTGMGDHMRGCGQVNHIG